MKFKKNGKKRKTWRKMTAREGGAKPADQSGGGDPETQGAMC